MILGLDVSTSSTGWAILDDSGNLVEMGSFNLAKREDLFDKARAVREGLLELRSKYQVSKTSI
jgi:CRISPR/Cas system Type II protein with McrA/HNH and RuvC-like nuclease domain